jgi:tetratricopeptide (TPR) repeat protein
VARTELAEFLRRRDRNQQAVETFHEVLGLDAGYVWAYAELCQLYTRLGDYPVAETNAKTAVERYRAAGNRSGEAQALLCLGEAQRDQGGMRLAEARRNVAAARGIFETLDQRYNLSRAGQYQGVVEYADGNFPDAARFFEEAATESRAVGNRSTEGLALMNLGVTQRQLGQPAKAIDYLRRSRDVFEQIGIERRAAEAEMNAAGLQIEYGIDQSEAVRRLANARTTLEKLGYVDFQVNAMDLEAASLRQTGRLAEARRELVAALSIAREKQLIRQAVAITVAIAQTDLLLNDYESARKSLEELLTGNAEKALDARITLGTVYTRLGEFDAARTQLEAALVDAAAQPAQFVAAVRAALGELAYESGKLPDAREQFGKAAALWTDDVSDAAAVEARSFVGFLDASAHRDPKAMTMIQASIERARAMGRLDLEVRCRLHLARLQIGERRYAEAVATLDGIPLEGERTVGPERQAQVRYWRSRALVGRGDPGLAASEAARARKLIVDLQAALPAAGRDRFASRSEIRPLVE